MIEFTDNTRAFTVTETAQILELSPVTIRKYLSEGRIHGEKIKARIYIDEAEIERFKEEREHR